MREHYRFLLRSAWALTGSRAVAEDVVQDCFTSAWKHRSAEYMQYQPATAPRAYWDTMTKRMKLVFKAPFADEDIPLIGTTEMSAEVALEAM